jgi:hypothetical protein
MFLVLAYVENNNKDFTLVGLGLGFGLALKILLCNFFSSVFSFASRGKVDESMSLAAIQMTWDEMGTIHTLRVVRVYFFLFDQAGCTRLSSP